MRIQPHHHDGEGTSASLHAFMTSLGHDAPQPVATYPRPASLDIASTVQRMRARGIRPPVDRGLVRGMMIGTPLSIGLYVGIGMLAAHAAGRF